MSAEPQRVPAQTVTTTAAGALVPGVRVLTVEWCEVCQCMVTLNESQPHQHQILE